MKLKRKKHFKIEKSFIFGIASALVIIIIAFLLMQYTALVDGKMFSFITGIALIIAGLPFFTNLLVQSKKAESKETMFLEFSRDLVEGVKSGTSISKSIVNLRNKNYGSLNPHVIKLANQLSIGIPVRTGLTNFSRDVKSRVISRAITLIQEAERAGGKIEDILESVASSVSQIEKLRKERKAAIYSLIVQGYIVFLIFIIIMLVMQFKILPITSELGLSGAGESSEFLSSSSGFSFQGSGIDEDALSSSFLYLLIVQGLFAGLVIGKISEGTVKAGLKHSFILVALSILISTGANLFLG
jgi:archaeal flagellar protein FlaJ